MFAHNLRTQFVLTALLIPVILLNSFGTSPIAVQASKEDVSSVDSTLQDVEQDNRTNPTGAHPSDDAENAVESQQTAKLDFGTFPTFVENIGQFDPRTRFQAQVNGAIVNFSDDAIWFTLLEARKVDPNDVHPKVTSRDLPRETRGTRRGVNLKVNLIGSNPHPGIESFNESDTSFSYFSGSDQSAWHTNVPIWGGIRYVDIYPGMDLEITSEGNLLVWEFLITDPSRFYNQNNLVSRQGIRIKIAGHQRIQVQPNGIDVITEVGTLVMPVIRLNGMELIPQVDNNGEIVIPVPTQTSAPIDVMKFVSYVLSKETRRSELDSAQPYIDTRPSLAPEDLLLYSTFLGGSVGDFGAGLAVDQDQMVYVSGKTRSSNFPEAPGPVNGSHDMGFVAKIDMLNNQLVYVAFLGGNDYSTEPADIAVDGNGNAYVTGYTTSDSFPTTSGVLDSDWDGDSFVTKLNASGNGLIYSTFLGGSRSLASIEDADARSIEVDNNGFAYIAGYTVDEAFASTNVGYDQSHNGGWDVFVTKINQTATQQVYFTYIGGGGSEFLSDLALDGAGAIYITGYTDSNNFPTTPTSYDPSYATATDAFVVKLDPTGTNRVYSTFLGGFGSDYSSGIAVNSAGSAFVVLATVDFPITSTIAPDNNPNSDGLVVKLDPSGSNLLFSAHISDDSAFLGGIAVDSSGYAYTIGSSITHGEQTSPGAYDQVGSKDDVDCQGPSYPYKCFDVFIQRLHPSGESLVYGSYFGGSNAELGAKVVADNTGNIVFLVSNTISDDFPTTSPNAIDDSLGVGPDGSGDAAIVQMDTNIPFDCSGTTLSTDAGRAVLGVLQEDNIPSLNYCQNQVQNVIYVPAPGGVGDPNEAFNQWADLARNATREVAFTVMLWDKRNPQNDDQDIPYPGEFVLQGVRELYDKFTDPDATGNYPDGMTVRILLGVQRQYVPWPLGTDQRHFVLDELVEQAIPIREVLSDGRVWKVEVALYREGFGTGNLPPLSTGKFSHVKLMVVDSNEMIVSGYHPQYNFGTDIDGNAESHDLGLRVSGPIAANGMAVFDSLWDGSEILCTEDMIQISNWDQCDTAIGESPAHLAVAPAGNDVVLPLYRDDDQKTADKAVKAAIEAANEQVYVVQNRFMVPWPPYPVPWRYTENGLLEYARALLNVAPTTDIRILVSQDPINFAVNAPSVANFLVQYYLAGGSQPPGNVVRFYAPNEQVGPLRVPGLHTKSFMIDGEFLVIGSQNFDNSAFGESWVDLDLAEYSLGIEDSATVTTVRNYFDTIWENSGRTVVISPDDSIKTGIEQASPGSVILVEPGVYELSSMVAIPAGVTIFGQDAVLKPAAASSSQNGMFNLDTQSSAPTAEPLLRINGSNVTLMGLTIQDSPGYAMEIGDGSIAFENIYLSKMVFANNTLGGISVRSHANGGSINYTIENNTFVAGGSAITIGASSAATIRNNIFAGQSVAPIQITSEDDGNVEYSYNLFYDCAGGNCTSNWHAGNLGAGSSAHDNLFDLDPRFVNPEFGDYRLSSLSPAIDAGDPSILHELLYDGNGDSLPRIDLGAFEYLGESYQPTPTPTSTDTPTSTATPTPTFTPTNTPTNTPTSTPTFTPTATQTPTNTPTNTPTFTPTATQTPTTPPNACTPTNSYGSSQGAFQFASFSLATNATNFNRLPLSFVPNRGQEDQAVRFQARGLGGNLFFTPSEVVFSLPNPVRVTENDRANVRYDLHPANVVRIHYQDANENPQVVALGQLPGVVNVLKGDNPSRWRTNLPTYSGIAYRELYPGIDLRYEGTDGQLKSTFHVAPGADPSAIIWRYRGVDRLSTDEDGNLVVNLPEPAGAGAVLLEQAPIAWQEVGGNRVMVPVQYAVNNNDKKVSFVFPDGYDASLPLVIDPTITYSTYLGGVRTDEGHALTLDVDCNIYVTGDTSSSNFPTVNPFQQNPPTKDIFVSKLNPAGDTLLYSTYIGGNASDQAWGIALDSQGRITVVGESESSDFPRQNAYDNTFGGGTCEDSEPCDDVVVVQLIPDGSALRYSTYLGGTQQDNGYALAIGPGDKIHITGATRSSAFPAVNAYDSSFGGGTCSDTPCYDAFVATIDPSLTGSASLLYSSFLGGNNYDDGMGIAVDSAGHVYLTGYTRSDGFPARSAYRSTRVGSTDAFIAKFNTTLSGDASLLYSTYFGGTGDDRALGVALNGVNQVYITGFTKSTNFPLANPFDNSFGGGTCGSSACTDAFVTHLNIGNNTLVYSSYLGGGHHDEGAGITVDDNGNAYVTGFTRSTNFNTLNPIQPAKASDSCSSVPCADAFLTNVSSSGALVYSTYLGGTAEDYGMAVVLDGMGNTYLTGYTFSSNFPDAVNQFVGESGYADAFIVKIHD